MSGPRGRAWTLEEDDNLIYLLDKDIPIQKIAEQLNRTRAAVLERIARLHRTNRTKGRARKRSNAVVAGQQSAESAARREGNHVTLARKSSVWLGGHEVSTPPEGSLLALGRCMCRWPLWSSSDPPDRWLFCSAPTESGRSWCDKHRIIGSTGLAPVRIVKRKKREGEYR